MKLRGNLPQGHGALLFSTSGTGSYICLVAQTQLTYQGLQAGMDHCPAPRQGVHNLFHMRDEAMPRKGFDPTLLKDLLITSRTPDRLGHWHWALVTLTRLSFTVEILIVWPLHCLCSLFLYWSVIGI